MTIQTVFKKGDVVVRSRFYDAYFWTLDLKYSGKNNDSEFIVQTYEFKKGGEQLIKLKGMDSWFYSSNYLPVAIDFDGDDNECI